MSKKKGVVRVGDVFQSFCVAQSKTISNEALSPEENVFILLKNILRFTRSTQGGVLLPGKIGVGYQHFSINVQGSEDVQEETEFTLERKLIGVCITLVKPLVVNDFSKKQKVLKGRDTAGEIKNIIVVPIENKIFGRCGLYLIDRKGKDGFDATVKRDVVEMVKTLLPLLLVSVRSHALAEEVDNLKGLAKFQEDMMHMVVHDLKGPLAEVIANLDILKHSESLIGEGMDTLLSAEKGCTTLWRMVLEILDLAKLQENKLALKKEKVDVVELIDTLLDGLKLQLKGKNLSSVFDTQEEFPPIEVDKSLLFRVLNNFLLNSINYSPEGKKITVSLERLPAKKLKISIHDEGRGIKEEDIPLIFDKFNQSSEGGAKFSSGLGLTFCKFAIEAHGGEISVESVVKKGSTFHVILPVGASRLQLDGV